MNDVTYNRLKTIAAIVVIIEGVFLIVLMVVNLVLNFRSIEETTQNRQIACVGRFLDGAAYAPECEPYIKQYNENRNKE